MSYDPNQDPSSGYGNPPQGVPPQGPYGQPQDPYGTPPQGPFGQPQGGPYSSPPQGPYGQPQTPYGYGAPPQGPYGAPAYQQPGYGYGAPPVQAAPLPLGEAIRQLPNQYIKVLTKPSAATFAEEQGKAAWDIVWVQLLGIAILTGIFIFLVFQLVLPSTMSSSNVPAGTVAVIEGLAVGIALAEIILVPLFFFIGVGIYYLLARAFGGQGTFLAQSYSTLLFYIPLGIISLVLGLIPLLGSLIGIAIFIYEIVLGIFMIMGTHRLGGGKATLVVLLPLILLFTLSCLIFIIALVAASGARPH